MDKGQIKADTAAAQTHKHKCDYLLCTDQRSYFHCAANCVIASTQKQTRTPALACTTLLVFIAGRGRGVSFPSRVSLSFGAVGPTCPVPRFLILSAAHTPQEGPSPRRGAQTTGIITVKSSCGENLRLRFHYTRASFGSFIPNLTLLQR